MSSLSLIIGHQLQYAEIGAQGKVVFFRGFPEVKVDRLIPLPVPLAHLLTMDLSQH